jgi:hypothetical protein
MPPLPTTAELVVAWCRPEDTLDKSPPTLHADSAAFIALMLTATNQHGDQIQFDRYLEYKCIDKCSNSSPLRFGFT